MLTVFYMFLLKTKLQVSSSQLSSRHLVDCLMSVAEAKARMFYQMRKVLDVDGVAPSAVKTDALYYPVAVSSLPLGSMIRQKPGNFSGSLCFEKHSYLIFLQKRMSQYNKSIS